MVLEKSLESPLDSKEIQPVNPEGNQSWIFIGRTDDEAEVPIFWPPYAKNWLIWKDPDTGKNWRQEEKWTTEDEMVGWHHRLYGYVFEQAPGVGDGQGSLAFCSPWVCEESDNTEWLNWTEGIISNQWSFGWNMPCTIFYKREKVSEESVSVIMKEMEVSTLNPNLDWPNINFTYLWCVSQPLNSILGWMINFVSLQQSVPKYIVFCY